MYRLFPDRADTALDKAARLHGQTILGGSSATIEQSTGGALAQMPSWMLRGHLRAATASSGRDIARVAATRDSTGYFAKAAELLEDAARIDRVPAGPFRAALEKSVERRTDELAAHSDRPTREHALSATQHRELAREHEVHAYEEFSGGNLEASRAHQAAADAHSRASVLASERHSDFPVASHRARESTRRCNRICHEQVRLPEPHAAKAAHGDGFSRPAGAARGSNSNFGSQTVPEERFREPRGNTRAFQQPERVTGARYESGYDYPSSAPAHLMTRLFGPPQNAASMEWSSAGADPDQPGRERAGAVDYRSSEPAKAAGYDPSMSLTALAKARIPGSPYDGAGSARISKSLDLAHALAVSAKLPESAYRGILRLRDFKARAKKSTYRNIQADADYRETVRMIQAAPIEESDRRALLASIA